MKIYDFNVHFPCILGTNKKMLLDIKMTVQDLDLCYDQNRTKFTSYISSANFMIFNQKICLDNSLKQFFHKVKTELPNSLFTILVDFRIDNIYEYLEKAIDQGITGIKFHSYYQKISETDFSSIAQICQFAENRNLMIFIDTSYGTSKMYDYDNMKLACFISDFITKVPIILLHSGSARVIEAMLLADEKKNIFLDTSFSLLYYLGASLEQDFAYAYKKIGSNRILYGSDTPYIDFHESITKSVDFFEKHHFTSEEIENIFFKTAHTLKDFNV